MTNWLKQNWGKVLIGLIILFLLYGGVDALVSKYQYRKKIKTLDTTISELWQKIGDSQRREESWMKSSNKHYALAMEKEAKIRKKDAEMRVKLAEKRALKKKIREMPATQVIVQTIKIINCPDVVQQEQGVVFTLDCAKDNLVILENVFYFKKEALDWADQFFTSQTEVVDLKNVIIADKGIITERGNQLGDAYEIIDNWVGKFKLSEKRGKANWWKGIKTGGTIGGVAGIILGFFLGK